MRTNLFSGGFAAFLVANPVAAQEFDFKYLEGKWTITQISGPGLGEPIVFSRAFGGYDVTVPFFEGISAVLPSDGMNASHIKVTSRDGKACYYYVGKLNDTEMTWALRAGDSPKCVSSALFRKEEQASQQKQQKDKLPPVLRGDGDTGSVAFGGSPYCNYIVHINNPALIVELDNSNKINRATMSLVMVELSVPPCPYQPIGTKVHSYTGNGTINGNHASLQLGPSENNQPKAVATFEGSIVDGRLIGTITVKRIDLRDSLAWTVQTSTR